MARWRPFGALAAFLIVAAGCSNPAEGKLRAQIDTWKGTPYLDAGSSHAGISNAGFVRAVFHDTFGGSRTNGHSYPESLLRIGVLAEWFELRIGQNFGNVRTTVPRDGSLAQSKQVKDTLAKWQAVIEKLKAGS